ncbi:MAG: acyltransferase [Oscillospiraceae bacterium]
MNSLSEDCKTSRCENEVADKTVSTNFNSVDLMKFICSIFVVCIHTSPLSAFSPPLNFELNQILARLAVPFFFLTASYFFFKKIDTSSSDYFDVNSQYFRKYIKRLCLLYIIWSGIYFIYITYSWFQSDESITNFIFSAIRGLLLTGVADYLWYMAALIFATVTIYFSLKYISIKSTILIGFALYIIGLFGDSYFGFIVNTPVIGSIFKRYNLLFLTTRNGLFFGIIFIALGAYLAKNNFVTTSKKLIILFTLSFLLMSIEAFTLGLLHIPKDYNMYFFLVPTTVFLFLLLLNIKLKPSPIYRYLRDLSVLIYFSHIIFCTAYPMILGMFNPNAQQNNVSKFFFTLFSSILFSASIIWLSQFKHLRFLKKLY